MSVPNFRKSYHTVLGAAIDFPLHKNNKYSCKQRCGFLQRLRNQGKMYILHNFGKKSKRRKEEWCGRMVRCGFLLRLRNQGKMYILYNFGKESKRREEGKNRGKKSEERSEIGRASCR